MFKSLTILLITIIFGFSPFKTFAQNINIKVKPYTVKNGLLNSNIRSITQDKDGFIWIATLEGLDRFDGYDFMHFQNIEKDTTSLPTNDIRSLMYDSRNNLWIGTAKGLSKYIFSKNHFIHLISESNSTLGQFDITNITEDADGELWLATNLHGVVKFNPVTGKINRFLHSPNNPGSISSNHVLNVFKDSKNNIWICTYDAGISLFNPEDNTFEHYKHIPADPFSLASNDVHSMAEDLEGNIWIACHYAGLSCAHINEIKKGKFKNFVFDPKSKNSPIGHKTRIVCADRTGGLWIGNEDGKIDYYSNGVFYHYDFRECPLSLLSENQTNSIFQDNNNDLWVGTHFGGIYMVHKTDMAFSTYNLNTNEPVNYTNNKVWEFAEDKDGMLWIATDDGGLKLFNPKTNVIKGYTTITSNLSTNKVLCVYIDSKERIWVGTWLGGLNSFNPTTGLFKAYTNKNTELLNNNIFDITEDFDGNIWLATQNGLSKFNPTTEKVKTYTPGNSGLIYNQLEVIKTDSFGNLLIGNIMGFLIFNPITEKFTSYQNDVNDEFSLSNNYVHSIFEENKSTIWIATRNGLNRFDKKSGQFKRYFVTDGLSSNMVFGIEKDNNGNFWISSNYGISELDLSNNIVRNYTVDDGLQDYQFIKKSHFKTKDGRLLFGGIKGFNVISISEKTNFVRKGPLVFTEFLISNKVVKPGDKSKILDSTINLTKEITLTHKHPTFSFKYAVVSFLNPENIRYAYKLEGFDEDWNYVGNQRQATYTNINPGNYVLKVMNVTSGNPAENDFISLNIRILPPWWKTLLFKISLIFILTSFIIAVFLSRVNNLKNQKIVLEREVNKRTQELINTNKKLIEKQNELTDANKRLEETQDEIIAQNDELERHRNNLENMVSERTHELELAMKKAEESDKLKSAFLANLSHEIRTPMNAIVGFASFLDSEEISLDDRRNCIETINNNCETLTVLINDIIDISLIESNQVKINSIQFHVDAILSELHNTYEFKKNKNIELIFDNQNNQSPLIINNDPVRFKQVFSNLISNALKYTEKGHIQFGYQVMNDYIKFYVSDTGIGISQSDYDKIFSQFHKIENSENKLYRGVGIGLSICKSLIELMGGEIWLESKLDEGTTFYIKLPYHNASLSESRQPGAKDLHNRPDLTGIRILIAENEPDNFLLLQKILSSTNAEITWAKNGLEAVEKVEEMNNLNDFLILMDIKMPIMDGIEATKNISARHNQIPIIAVTAYANENDKAIILQNNFSGYVTKPINISYLIDIILESLK